MPIIFYLKRSLKLFIDFQASQYSFSIFMELALKQLLLIWMKDREMVYFSLFTA
jgi:hypothetical protein